MASTEAQQHEGASEGPDTATESETLDPVIREQLKHTRATTTDCVKCLLSHEVSANFQEMTDGLMSIAKSLAKLNRARLSKVIIGARVPELPESEQNTLSSCFDDAIDIALKMLELEANADNESANGRPSMFSRAFQSLGGSRQVMQSAAATKAPPSRPQVFVSFSRQENAIYVPSLFQRLEESFLDLQVFRAVDLCGYYLPYLEIFRALMRADCMLNVCCYHAVQNHWPLAELICGLARNVKHGGGGRGILLPVVFDAMPGMTWLQSELGDMTKARLWAKDLKALFPGQLEKAGGVGNAV